MARLLGKIKKGWGHEEIFVSNDSYCGKFLVFDKSGASFSMHFHAKKEETWYVMEGMFEVSFIDTTTANMNTFILRKGDKWTNKPLSPHKLTNLTPFGKILEISTPDSIEDNYRVMPGDSQNV